MPPVLERRLTMERWTIQRLNELDDKRFAICILQERLNGLSNPYSPLATKLAGAIRSLGEGDSRRAESSETQVAKKVMDAVKGIEESDYPEPVGLLGFCIESEIDSYDKAGNGIISVFNRHPDQADILEEMLIAICGWGIEGLKERMEENAEHYSEL